MSIKSYSEAIRCPTFDERLKYLYLGGSVGVETFGFSRYLNQKLYNSDEWRRLRNDIILRDNGCDMALKGYDIYDKIFIHHINPITERDVVDRAGIIFDPDNLICVSFDTHQAIHYGMEVHDKAIVTERHPNDTKLW